MGNWYCNIKVAGTPLRHKHLIIRVEVKDPPDGEGLKGWVSSLASAVGLDAEPKLCTSEVGYSVLAASGTGHIMAYVWNAENNSLLQLDVYSSAHFSPQKVFDHITETMDTSKMSYKFLNREHGMHESNLGWSFKR